jgi:acetyl-CoA carboxylase biotin carboxylase subunit
MDPDGRFYFIEMNARVQVEHPVTEMVTGADIVGEQIGIAAGQELAMSQNEVRMNGHAIECRINAEDPERNFAPCPGKIEVFHVPGGPGIRVDTHAYAQYVMSPYYDSLVAKLVAHGRDRSRATARLRRALDEFYVEGIQTTIGFHKKAIASDLFRSGRFDTSAVTELVGAASGAAGGDRAGGSDDR